MNQEELLRLMFAPPQLNTTVAGGYQPGATFPRQMQAGWDPSLLSQDVYQPNAAYARQWPLPPDPRFWRGRSMLALEQAPDWRGQTPYKDAPRVPEGPIGY